MINLGNEGEQENPVKIRVNFPNMKDDLIALLKEFKEIFAWSYQDMLGLDTEIVIHRIPVKSECLLVWQALRRMKLKIILKFKEEVEKQLKAGFLTAITNMFFSFMGELLGHNQIKIAKEDKAKTTFTTHWGTYTYDVMPFSLKNTMVTYQRAMVTLFHDKMHKEIEVYVDEMIAKSHTPRDHLIDLRKLCKCLIKNKLMLNPNKYIYGAKSGKLLDFIVSRKGIEMDLAKVWPSGTCLRRKLRKRFEASWEGSIT